MPGDAKGIPIPQGTPEGSSGLHVRERQGLTWEISMNFTKDGADPIELFY